MDLLIVAGVWIRSRAFLNRFVRTLAIALSHHFSQEFPDSISEQACQILLLTDAPP